MLNPAYPTREDLLDQARFRRGFSHLAPLGLSFDAWLYFHQLPRLTALARAFPGTRIILNHCGGILGQGHYAGRQADVFRQWRTALGELASCPNVTVKLGGLGMRRPAWFRRVRQHAVIGPAGGRLASWIETCIEVFGSPRCMFESNFPADRASHGYARAGMPSSGWRWPPAPRKRRICSGAAPARATGCRRWPSRGAELLGTSAPLA